MRKELNQIEYIERYLLNQLNAQEKQAFEEAVEEDEGLKKSVLQQQLVQERIFAIAAKEEVRKAAKRYRLKRMIKPWIWILSSILVLSFAFSLINFDSDLKEEKQVSKVEEVAIENVKSKKEVEEVIESESPVNADVLPVQVQQEPVKYIQPIIQPDEIKNSKPHSKWLKESVFSHLMVPFDSVLYKQNSGAYLKYSSGSVLSILPNSLVNSKGQKLKLAYVYYREFRDQADIISSNIPMVYYDPMDTLNMKSYGMYEVRAKSLNGTECFLEDGQNYMVNFQKVGVDKEIDFFELENDSIWRKRNDLMVTSQFETGGAPMLNYFSEIRIPLRFGNKEMIIESIGTLSRGNVEEEFSRKRSLKDFIVHLLTRREPSMIGSIEYNVDKEFKIEAAVKMDYELIKDSVIAMLDKSNLTYLRFNLSGVEINEDVKSINYVLVQDFNDLGYSFSLDNSLLTQYAYPVGKYHVLLKMVTRENQIFIGEVEKDLPNKGINEIEIAMRRVESEAYESEFSSKELKMSEINSKIEIVKNAGEDFSKKARFNDRILSEMMKNSGPIKLSYYVDRGHDINPLMTSISSVNFGVFNCDQTYRIKDRIAINGSFYVNDSLKNFTSALKVVDYNVNGAFSFSPDYFYISKTSPSKLILFDDNGSIYAVSEEKLKSALASQSKTIRFDCDDVTDQIKTPDDLRAFLGIKK